MPGIVRPDASSLVSAVLFALIVAGFGSAFALNAVAVTAIPPIWVAAIRAGVACAIFVTVVLTTGRRIAAAPRDIGTYALIGLTTGAVPFFLLAWGQRIVPSSLASVLFASVPLMTVFLSWGLFRGPRPTALRAAGAVLGLIGVAIAFPDAGSVDRGQLIGAVAVLLAALSYAFGGLFLQRARTHDPFALMAGQFALVTLALGISASVGAPYPKEASSQLLAAIVLGATGSALPLMCFLLLLRRTDPVIASSVTFFIPFVAIGLGIALLAEPATLEFLTGFAVCILGSALVLQPNPPKRKEISS